MVNFEKVLVYNAIIKLILVCIYFLKNYKFWYLRMLGNFIISYILDYGFKPLKFFGFDSFQCKDIFLKLFTLSVLLWLILTNKVNFILNNIFDIKFFIFCLYLVYKKVEIKKENFLFLQFEIRFYLYLVGFFIMYPIFKVTNLFFIYLFKYLENLYHNLLPKLNIMLAFFGCTMLNFLEEINKYSSNGLFLVFFFFLMIYFYLKKIEKFYFLLKAYLFCINIYIAFCVLTEKLGFFYKIILEQVLFKPIKLSKEIFFIDSNNKKELQNHLLMKVYKNNYEYSCMRITIKYGCVVSEKSCFIKKKTITQKKTVGKN